MALWFVENLLSDPNPAFACYANRDGSKKEAFVAPVVHLANPAADPALLEAKPKVPGADAARELYAAHDGVLLYTSPMSNNFADFFELIWDRPAYFLNVLLLCYTRFDDGKTTTEWLPSRYLPDSGNPSVGR